jgi:hypothetical protein
MHISYKFYLGSTLIFIEVYTVAHLVEELRYKEEGCGFDFQWGKWDFSLT